MLLATAKRLRALVRECCRPGSLLVCFRLRSLARGRSFAARLPQHGCLLGDLELDLEMIGREQEAPGEQRQHPADAILAQLPGSLMTRLVVHQLGSVGCTVRTACKTCLAKALAVQPMRQLRELQLLDRYAGCANQVVRSAVAGSRQLTSVVVSVTSYKGAAAVIRCVDVPLAAQLQQLVVHSVGGEDTCDPLGVAHLTRLTRLVMPAPLDSCSSGMPSSVVSLGTAASADAAPQLLALTQLTQLQLQYAARMPAVQLRLLSGLRQLQHLELEESDNTSEVLYVAEAASSFSVLPLKHLVARWSAAQELTAASLADVGRCTGLTRLALECYTLAPGVGVEQLAAALAQLTALRHLWLTPPPLGAAIISGGATEALCRAVGGLQHLTASGLDGHTLGPTVVHLTGAAALTSLSLDCCGLEDAGVAALCAALPGLQTLGLWNNAKLTDASLAAIASTQQQLTQLRVPARGAGRISPHGLERLAAALPWLDIWEGESDEEDESDEQDEADDGFDSDYGSDYSSGYDSEYDSEYAEGGGNGAAKVA